MELRGVRWVLQSVLRYGTTVRCCGMVLRYGTTVRCDTLVLQYCCSVQHGTLPCTMVAIAMTVMPTATLAHHSTVRFTCRKQIGTGCPTRTRTTGAKPYSAGHQATRCKTVNHAAPRLCRPLPRRSFLYFSLHGRPLHRGVVKSIMWRQQPSVSQELRRASNVSRKISPS